MKNIVLLLTVLVSAPALADRGACDEDFEKTIDLEHPALIELFVEARAGSLLIEGDSSVDNISIVGSACASSQKLLDQIDIVLEQKGRELQVIAQMPENGLGRWGRVAYLDLNLKVPTTTALSVDDGSGSTVITGVASLALEDGSGSIEIEDVAGNVEVDDGSGSILIMTVGGEVLIEDGSGSINVEDVEGNVLIEEDGSGSIDIRSVRQNVTIESDGSGGVSVAEIGGDFSVLDDGSGGIRYENVAGTVDIPRDKRSW